MTLARLRAASLVAAEHGPNFWTEFYALLLESK
jgi:hypothetical protein